MNTYHWLLYERTGDIFVAAFDEAMRLTGSFGPLTRDDLRAGAATFAAQIHHEVPGTWVDGDHWRIISTAEARQRRGGDDD